jgi:hypothetical protein
VFLIGAVRDGGATGEGGKHLAGGIEAPGAEFALIIRWGGGDGLAAVKSGIEVCGVFFLCD